MTTHLFTVYCGHAHRLLDGAPIGHACRVLDPEFLEAERGGDALRAIGLLARMRLVLPPGIPPREVVTEPSRERDGADTAGVQTDGAAHLK